MSARARAAGPVLLAVLVLAACAPAADADRPSPPAGIALPPTAGVLDYQLGAAYPPEDHVQIVARDRSADPAGGLYSICYLNGFQTQPGERDTWPAETLLRGDDGAPVIDPDWPDEVILDTSTADNRATISGIVSRWIEDCAAAGFQAVEFDNLDTFTRTGGALRVEDNVALATTLVGRAHRSGLAAGQKNAAEYASVLREDAGFDFAIAEECAAYQECGAYSDVYGAAVIDIEYTDNLPKPFGAMCRDKDSPPTMVLRDRGLSAPGNTDYAFEYCPR